MQYIVLKTIFRYALFVLVRGCTSYRYGNRMLDLSLITATELVMSLH